MIRRMKSLRGNTHQESFQPYDMETSNISDTQKTTGTSASKFHEALNDPDIVERVRINIKDAHVFKLPIRTSASIGHRGSDWKEKVWQGSVKVVERGEHLGVVLVDKDNPSNIFAVCPVRDGAIDRCIDSSRYFVLKIENSQGRHMFIGMAFNERNDAFDFNTSLEDARREREAELNPTPVYTGPTIDYSIKEGQKIHVAIPQDKSKSPFGKKTLSDKKPSRGFLAPSSKDTPSRSNQFSQR